MNLRARNTLRASLRKAAFALTPRPVLERYRHHKLVRQARRLHRLSDSVEDLSVLIDALWASYFFRPIQKRSEITRLVEIVKAQGPKAVCEIGAAGGGTVFLFAHAARADARIITLDLKFTPSRQAAVRRFARGQQQIICLEADSHRPETLRAVSDALDGRGLDLLYIDGDHSYQGVADDFKLYSPLVRPGGLVVFHDIVPDFKTRYGIETSSETGGVPQLWQELKAAQHVSEEIIEDPAQDGFGIGVLCWNGRTELKF